MYMCRSVCVCDTVCGGGGGDVTCADMYVCRSVCVCETVCVGGGGDVTCAGMYVCRSVCVCDTGGCDMCCTCVEVYVRGGMTLCVAVWSLQSSMVSKV